MRHATVPDSGSLEAPFLLAGEAPGKREMQEGAPFVGPSGWEMNRWWRGAGLSRGDFYLTNVLPYMPPVAYGALDGALKGGQVTREEIEAGWQHIRGVANQMPNLRVICPVGNYATRAFTNYGKVQWSDKVPGITSVRGFPFTFALDSGREVWVVPTIHPAAVLRGQGSVDAGGNEGWAARCRQDWQKISRISADGIRYQEPTVAIMDNVQALEHFYHRIQPEAVLSIDIETWGGAIQCIGFALDSTQAVVVPTGPNAPSRRGGYEEEQWRIIRQICAHPCDKLFQNGMFDTWWLERYDCPVVGYAWDTMDMHHALNPTETHSLEFLASVYTDAPYWKDEAKQSDVIERIARNEGMDKLYHYNGMDVCVTFEIFEKLYDELIEQDMMGFYQRHYMWMREPLRAMMRDGVRVDVDAMREANRTYLAKARGLRDQASQLAEIPLFVFDKTKCERAITEIYTSCDFDSMGSGGEGWASCLRHDGFKDDTIDKKMVEFDDKGISDDRLRVVFDDWKIPKGARTKLGKTKLDSVALKGSVHNLQKFPSVDDETRTKYARLVDITLEHRRYRKLASFFNPKKVDDDGYIRCEYRFVTRSGRLASRSNPGGTGMNLQNPDRDTRHVYIASPGHVMLECDLSQAEDRVVKVLTGADYLIERARRPVGEGDEHTELATYLFNKPFDDVTKEERYCAKRVRHASNYGMSPPTMSDTLLKDGFVFTTKECEQFAKVFHEQYPEIKTRFQFRVREVIGATRELYTSWGRRVGFEHMQFTGELYRFGYSWIPQSEVGDLLNQQGLLPLYRFIKKNRLRSRVVLQVHDSVVVDAHPDEVHPIMHVLQENLEMPRTYGACLGIDEPLSIPVEFGLGRTWKKVVEWKGVPPEADIRCALEEVLA